MYSLTDLYIVETDYVILEFNFVIEKYQAIVYRKMLRNVK